MNVLALEVTDLKVSFTKDEEIRIRQMVLDGENCADISNHWQSLAEVNEGLLDQQTQLTETYKIKADELASQNTKASFMKYIYIITGGAVGYFVGRNLR